MRSNQSFTNVYSKKNTKSNIVTQILYGDTFKKIKKSKSWIKIKNDSDNYKGYIKNKKFFPNQKNTHKVFNLYANLYSKPNNRYKIHKKLSFGSKIRVIKKNKGFYNFDNSWIKKKDLKEIDFKKKKYIF